MTKKIKFPLIMKDNVQVRSIEELREHFDLMKATAYFLNGKLQTWLEQRYYDSEAAAIKLLKDSDPDFHKKLCEILGTEYKEDDIKVDIDLVKERDRRLNELKQYTSDQSVLDKIDQVAFNQEELAYLLDEGVHDIYLCNNSFSIPIRIPNKKYIGIGKVVAVIHSDWEVDFWARRIEIVNMEFNPEYEELCNPTPEKLYRLATKARENNDKYLAQDYYLRAIRAGSIDAFLFYSSQYWGGGKIGGDVFFDGCNFTQEKYVQFARIEWIKKRKYAFDLLMKAVNLGNAKAMREIGRRYFLEDDYDKETEWYRKAADAGNEDAMCRIADFYLAGSRGYIKDEEKAIMLYKKAANLGSKSAMENLLEINEQKKEYTLHHRWLSTLCSSQRIEAVEFGMFWNILERNNYVFPNVEYQKFVTIVINLCNRVLVDNTDEKWWPGLYVRCAIICNKLDRFDMAMRFIAKALDTMKGKSLYGREIYECLGDIYKDKGLYKEAIKAYDKAVAYSLLSEPPYDTLEHNATAERINEKLDWCKGQLSQKG